MFIDNFQKEHNINIDIKKLVYNLDTEESKNYEINKDFLDLIFKALETIESDMSNNIDNINNDENNESDDRRE